MGIGDMKFQPGSRNEIVGETKQPLPGVETKKERSMSSRKATTESVLGVVTQLAGSAISHLESADSASSNRALNAIRNKNIAPGGLINYLDRKVKIGDVLGRKAKEWSEETKQDFLDAFATDAKELDTDAMDSIVSVAILNDPDLDDELLLENAPEVTQDALLEERRIVFQHPPPGTPLEPPYLMLVAVEQMELAKAEKVVDSIRSNLVRYQGFKIPPAVASKLK